MAVFNPNEKGPFDTDIAPYLKAEDLKEAASMMVFRAKKSDRGYEDACDLLYLLMKNQGGVPFFSESTDDEMHMSEADKKRLYSLLRDVSDSALCDRETQLLKEAY